MSDLALSLFHGADLFGLAFELEGWCVVCGPDVLFGRDIRDCHPPSGRFDLLIGSPPCQSFSQLVHLIRANGYEPKHGNLIPQFERCVAEAQPRTFVMEEVPQAPEPAVEGYAVHSFVVDNASLCDGTGFGHTQMRRRRFSFGVKGETAIDLRRWIQWAALELPDVQRVGSSHPEEVPVRCAGKVKARTVRGKNDGNPQPWEKARAVVAREAAGGISEEKAAWQRAHKKSGLAPGNHRARSWAECCRLQGMPEDWLMEKMPDGRLRSPLFTKEGRHMILGNGVPLSLGRAIARAVCCALESL